MPADPFKSIIYRVLRAYPATLPPTLDEMDLIVEAYRWVIGDVPLDTLELAARESCRISPDTVPSAGLIYIESQRLLGV